jgi:hypothetical protein
MPADSPKADHRLMNGVTVKKRIIADVRAYTAQFPEMRWPVLRKDSTA